MNNDKYLDGLYEFQKKLFLNFRQELQRNKYKSGIIQLPTGGGKSRIAAKIALSAYYKKLKLFVVAHRGEIILQLRHHLINTGIPQNAIGLIKAPNSSDFAFTPDRPVQVGMIQSFTQNYEQWKEQGIDFAFDTIIIDECHLATSDSYIKLFNAFPKAHKIGFTATPEPPKGKTFRGIFQTIVCGASPAELITLGMLPRGIYYGTKPPDISDVRINNGDYVSSQLASKFNTNELRADLVKTWINKVQKPYGNIPTICFAAGVEHSKAISNEYKNAGIGAVHIDGKMGKSDRYEALKKFINGSAPILCNCDVLTEGFDLDTYCKFLGLPSISVGCVQLAASTLRITKANQRRGRARGVKIDGKLTAIYLDHANIIGMHGRQDDPHEWTLDGLKAKKTNTKLCPEEDADINGQWGCGRADVPKSDMVCPYCGFLFSYDLEKFERESTGRKKTKYDREAELQLLEESVSERFRRILSKAKSHQWALQQLSNYSPSYEELYHATKICKRSDGVPFKISAAFFQWVRGQKIINGSTWSPSLDDLLEVINFLIARGEKPRNTFEIWVNQCIDDGVLNPDNLDEILEKVCQVCGYKDTWRNSEKMEINKKLGNIKPLAG